MAFCLGDEFYERVAEGLFAFKAFGEIFQLIFNMTLLVFRKEPAKPITHHGQKADTEARVVASEAARDIVARAVCELD